VRERERAREREHEREPLIDNTTAAIYVPILQSGPVPGNRAVGDSRRVGWEGVSKTLSAVGSASSHLPAIRAIAASGKGS